MKLFKQSLMAGLMVSGMAIASVPAMAADYVIDTKGAHAFVNFKVSHLGYSFIYGRFNTFSGDFSFDPEAKDQSKINVTIDTASVDSNHAERDKHLRGEDFLNVEKFPEASFTSTAYKSTGEATGEITGDLTLHGVTKSISFDVVEIGAGSDPWGNERAGFEGTFTFPMADFGIDYNLGPASKNVEMTLLVEGIKK